MDAKNYNKTLKAMLDRKPFAAFKIELIDGESVEVRHPEELFSRAGVTIHIGPEGEMSIFDHEGVSRFISQSSRSGSRKSA